MICSGAISGFKTIDTDHDSKLDFKRRIASILCDPMLGIDLRQVQTDEPNELDAGNGARNKRDHSSSQLYCFCPNRERRDRALPAHAGRLSKGCSIGRRLA
jgi:hypothetical protein